MNGYCQIDLGGQKRGLKFNLHAVRIMADIAPAKSIEKWGFESPLFNTHLVYIGLCGNQYVKTNGVEPYCEETFEQVSDWVDEMIIEKKYDALKEVGKAFMSSKAFFPNGVEEKKSQTEVVTQMKKPQAGKKR